MIASHWQPAVSKCWKHLSSVCHLLWMCRSPICIFYTHKNLMIDVAEVRITTTATVVLTSSFQDNVHNSVVESWNVKCHSGVCCGKRWWHWQLWQLELYDMQSSNHITTAIIPTLSFIAGYMPFLLQLPSARLTVCQSTEGRRIDFVCLDFRFHM